jgi:hypothetical protein
MRKISGGRTAIIMAITLYFTLVWGYDALHIFTSPSYGLDEVWRSEYVFIVGRMFGLGPVGLIKLAAFFGAVKLAVAAFCGWHIVDRVRSMVGGEANADVLEGSLILIVAIGIMTAGFAASSGNGDIVREYAIQLVLAGLATALCIAERSARFGRLTTETEDVDVERPLPGSVLHP